MTARSSTTALAAAAAITMSALGSAAGAASAGARAEGWQPVQDVGPVGQAQYAPVVTMTGHRQAAASWNQGPGPDRLWVALTRNDAWSAPEQVPGVRRPLEQQIGGTGAGELLVAWADGRRVMTATMRPDGTWSTPLRLARTSSGPRGTYPGYLALDVNARGSGVLAWETVDDDADRILAPSKVRAVVRTPVGSWTEARTMSGRQGARPDVFVDAHGRATVVWLELGPRAGRVSSATWRARHGWSRAVALSRPGTGTPRLAGLPSGRKVVAWCDEASGAPLVRRGAPDGTWRPARRAPVRRGGCGWIDVGLDARGQLTVAWVNDRSAVWAVDRTSSRWRPAVRVAPRRSVFYGLQLGENRAGDTALSWQTWTGRRHTPQVARRPAGRGWRTPVVVAPGGETWGSALAVSGRGDVLVAWLRDRGGDDLSQVQARWFRAISPALTGSR